MLSFAISLLLFIDFIAIPSVLAGEHPHQEIRPGLHGGTRSSPALSEHQKLGLQNQQKGETTKISILEQLL